MYNKYIFKQLYTVPRYFYFFHYHENIVRETNKRATLDNCVRVLHVCAN